MISYCKLCNQEQDLSDYIFCDIECQRNFWLFIECRIKYMNHPFLSNKDSDNKICTTCNRDYLSHTGMALCESCNKRQNCDIFGNQLLCVNCFNKAINSEKSIVTESREQINDTILKNHEVLKSIEYNGDFFNSAAIALMELKKAITLTSQNAERDWQSQLVENITHLREHIFITNEDLARSNNDLLAHEKELRAIGDKLHQDFRNKLRESDSLYRPQIPTTKPKVSVKKNAQSPYDRMIEIIMVNKNVSKQDAERIFLEAQRNVASNAPDKI